MEGVDPIGKQVAKSTEGGKQAMRCRVGGIAWRLIMGFWWIFDEEYDEGGKVR